MVLISSTKLAWRPVEKQSRKSYISWLLASYRSVNCTSLVGLGTQRAEWLWKFFFSNSFHQDAECLFKQIFWNLFNADSFKKYTTQHILTELLETYA